MLRPSWLTCQLYSNEAQSLGHITIPGRYNHIARKAERPNDDWFQLYQPK